MKNNLIGISGKIGSGKDLVCDIIQYLTWTKGEVHLGQFKAFQLEQFRKETWSGYKRKSYAGKLKQMVCLLLGCTLDQLEDREFKEKELGEEWSLWYNHRAEPPTVHLSKQLADAKAKEMGWPRPNTIKAKLTPRRLLQLLGTDAGRNILHPNIWINALFADYNPKWDKEGRGLRVIEPDEPCVSTWIITDVRFPGEVKAIQDRGGVVIRLNRPRGIGTGNRLLHKSEIHESETALDSFSGFDHVVQNNGTIEELILKIKTIL